MKVGEGLLVVWMAGLVMLIQVRTLLWVRRLSVKYTFISELMVGCISHGGRWCCNGVGEVWGTAGVGVGDGVHG